MNKSGHLTAMQTVQMTAKDFAQRTIRRAALQALTTSAFIFLGSASAESLNTGKGEIERSIATRSQPPVSIAVRKITNMAGQYAEDGRDAEGNLVGWFKPSYQIRLAEILATELSNTGHFTVVEREKLYAVLEEQALTEVNPRTAAKKGNITGAKYIILASLSDFVPNVNRTRKNQDGRVLIFAFGNDRENVETYVAFDLRVIDTTTGEIAISRTIEGTSQSTHKADRFGMSFGFWGGGASENQTSETTPASRAVRAAMINIVEYLNCSLYLKDSCLSTYKAMDEKRKMNTKGTLNLF